MLRVRSIAQVRRAVAGWRARGLTVGFVPTMGALHEGHLSLMRRSKRRCDRTVVSIFVNPTQFAPNEDLSAYPRPLSADLRSCRNEGVDLVFTPSAELIYPKGFEITVKVGALGELWEGKSRPGHFDGVATVVLKLFTIVAPDVAFFGQKDLQQSVIIRRMVVDLNLPVRIVVAPTVRERDGLALSSRNVYLDRLSREAATGIHQALIWAKKAIRKGVNRPGLLKGKMQQLIEKDGCFSLDYIGFCDPSTLVSLKSAQPPIAIVVAAKCVTPGPAKDRRYIDNLIIH